MLSWKGILSCLGPKLDEISKWRQFPSCYLYLCLWEGNWVVCRPCIGYVVEDISEVSPSTTLNFLKFKGYGACHEQLVQLFFLRIFFRSSFLEEMTNSFQKVEMFVLQTTTKIPPSPWVLCSGVCSSYQNSCVIEMYIPSNFMWSLKAFVNQSVLFSGNHLKYCWAVWWNTSPAIGVFLHFCIDF